MIPMQWLFLFLSISHGQDVSSGAAAADGNIYDPAGLRDPFKPFKGFVDKGPDSKKEKKTNPLDLIDPLQRLDVQSLSVVAAIWDVAQPRAILKDPDGNQFTVVKGTKVGRNAGVVQAIREGEVVVQENYQEDGQTIQKTQVLELKKATGGTQ